MSIILEEDNMDKKIIKAFSFSILILLFFNVLNWYSKTIFVYDEAIRLENTENYIQNWVENINEEGVFLGRVPKVGSPDQYYLYINKQNNTYLGRSKYRMVNINSGLMVRIYNDTATDNVKGVVYKLTPNKKNNYILVKDENSQEKITVSKIPILQEVPFYERAKTLALSFLKIIVLATLITFIFIKWYK